MASADPGTIARHETAHLVAAHLLGWQAEAAELRDGRGDCYFNPPVDLDARKRELQRCVILLAASEFTRDSGWLDDRLTVYRIVRALAESPEDREWLDAKARYEAVQLVAEPAFQRAVYRMAEVLEATGSLDPDELRVLLRDDPPAFPPVSEWLYEDIETWERALARA